MTTNRRSPVLVAIALALAAGACGGEGERNVTRAAAGKSDAPGGEAIPASSRAPSRGTVPGATRPARPEDIALRAHAPARVGPVSDDAADRYPVRIEVQNVGADPVSLERVWLHASVYRDGLLVRGCGESRPELVTAAPLVLEPGQRFTVTHGLPCALTEPGRYDLASVVMVGLSPQAVSLEPVLEFAQSIASPMVIDASLSPFDAEVAQTSAP